MFLAHLDINFICNKFDLLTEGLSGNVDVIMISETKIVEKFPARQFPIEGYSSPYKLDQNCNGGGIIIYVRENISSKLFEITASTECILTEPTLRKKRCLITLIKISQNLSIISKNLDTLLTKYHNAVLIEYFIADKKGASLKDFCQSKSKHLIKVCTCFKTQIIPRSYIPC